MNVLIVPGTNGCASEIINSLSTMKGVDSFGGGSDLENSAGFPYCKFFYIPEISDRENAIGRLVSLVNDTSLEIDCVILTHDQWIYETRNLEFPPHIRFIRHGSHAIEVTSFKSRTYELFRQSIRVPKIFKSNEEEITFPAFAKPDRGQGSRGNQILNSASELERYITENVENYIICEYLPGKEFTVDCFSNLQSDLLFYSARERTEIDRGIAVSTKSVELLEISSMAQKISQVLKLSGAWFFQVKENGLGELVLMEIGLRIAGSSGIQRTRGINLMSAWIFQQAGLEIEIINPIVNSKIVKSLEGKDLFYDKAISQIYVDLDDTLILPNGELNSNLVQALVAARNSNISLHLITRHSGDLIPALHKRGIHQLFDNIFWITDGRAKSTYINGENNFLFIDDSFRERFEVAGAFPKKAICLDQTAFNDFSLKFN